MKEIEYKIVETSDVTDTTLTEIINEFVSQGWNFENIQFAMRESSKRPAMAFILFTRRKRENKNENSKEGT